jgi:hypothetical protein
MSDGHSKWILWILFCRANKNLDTLFPFYAGDGEQVEKKAAEILEKHPSYERLELKAYMPGTIDESVQGQPE